MGRLRPRRVLVSVIALGFVCAAMGGAAADPSERTDRDRFYQMVPVSIGGAVYLALEFGLKDAITPQTCRWCASNWLDTGARTRLKWENVRLANSLSNLTGYVGNPLLATGLLVLTTYEDADLRRWYDDTVPVLQAGIATGMLNQLFKVIAGRRRPFATFDGEVIRAHNDFHTSFFSGHTALAFAMTTSSGMVASLRGYRTAPALWIGGLALATTTGYLRVAADAHYLTDVVVGAVVGAAVGVAIPLLFHRDVLTDETATPRRATPAQRDGHARAPVILSFGGAF